MRVKESKMHKERLPLNEQFCLGLMDDLGVSFVPFPSLIGIDGRLIQD